MVTLGTGLMRQTEPGTTAFYSTQWILDAVLDDCCGA
jgi:hypothetical protein